MDPLLRLIVKWTIITTIVQIELHFSLPLHFMRFSLSVYMRYKIIF